MDGVDQLTEPYRGKVQTMYTLATKDKHEEQEALSVSEEGT